MENCMTNNINQCSTCKNFEPDAIINSKLFSDIVASGIGTCKRVKNLGYSYNDYKNEKFYVVDNACDAKLITMPDFGCNQHEDLI